MTIEIVVVRVLAPPIGACTGKHGRYAGAMLIIVQQQVLARINTCNVPAPPCCPTRKFSAGSLGSLDIDQLQAPGRPRPLLLHYLIPSSSHLRPSNKPSKPSPPPDPTDPILHLNNVGCRRFSGLQRARVHRRHRRRGKLHPGPSRPSASSQPS